MVSDRIVSPDGRRLYVFSQRGPSANGNLGVTFEISGPLFDRAAQAQGNG